MKEGLKEIVPRPLTERESGWVRDILNASAAWRGVDFSKTQVVAEGQEDEGICFVLRADEPENLNEPSLLESVGNLWIHVDDGGTINVQLSQWRGRLQELYVLYIDPKHPNRSLPDEWVEVSREAIDDL
jgi:hypothetical protein